jgi:hypothetical protein
MPVHCKENPAGPPFSENRLGYDVIEIVLREFPCRLCGLCHASSHAWSFGPRARQREKCAGIRMTLPQAMG